MFAPVPEGPRRRAGAAAAQLLRLDRLLLGHGLAVDGDLLQRGLVHVEVGLDLHAGLAGAERLGQQRVEARLQLALVARLGRLLAAAAAAARAVVLRPQELARAVGDGDVLALEALDGGGDELRDAAHRARLHAGRVAGEHDRGGGGGLLVGEQGVLGQHELDLRAADAVDLLDGRRDLALERALVGDLLLEVRGAELLLVEQLEALLAAAGGGHARGGEGDPGRADLRLLDGDRGAVGTQVVADALLVERGRDLAGVRRVHAGREDRVRRRGGEPEHEEQHADDGQRGQAEHDLRSRRELQDGLGDGRHLRLRSGCGRCPGRLRRACCGSARPAASTAGRARRP